ncbi:MAG: MptD family putative ECF transporter S component [Candidatus Jordarchaeum sp.]|uniref:MptD family putative ECF transporter S component n=1 Tax=Candidatus Jordarchaeum sp. TaxID=2823881 RepID=UPI00404B3C6C
MKGYFTTRELVYLALFTVLLYVISFVAIMTGAAISSVPGVKSISSAFFSAVVIALACIKIRKVGTMTFLMFMWGLISGLIFPAVPILLPATVSGGIAADLSVAVFRKDYSSEKATTLATGVRAGISTVVVLLLTLVFGGYQMRGASLLFQVVGGLIHVQFLVNVFALSGLSGSALSFMSQILTLGVLGGLMPNLGVPVEFVEFTTVFLGGLGFQIQGLETIISPTLILGVSSACAVLATLGGYVGVRIVRELKRAGVYQ